MDPFTRNTLTHVGQLPENYERIAVPPGKSWHVWLLSDHYEQFGGNGSRRRTYLGDLVYRAKYCDDNGAFDLLAGATRHCVLQLRRFPHKLDGFDSVSAVVAVLCHPPKKRSLPLEIAAAAASALKVPDLSAEVVKTRATPAAKLNPVLHADAYRILRRLDGQCILLVDDLYHTGTTLESVATQLRAANAAHVVGLCITKVHKGMTP